MSRGFVKDGDQEEVPVVPPRAFLPKGITNYVTPEGMEKLLKEKSSLLKEREAVTGNETDRRITYNFLNAKLELLEERIRSAVILKGEPDLKTAPKGAIAFGAYITLKMEEGGEEKSVRIVGADEADVSEGLISYFSPLARALFGHRRGDGIVVSLPTGAQSVTIIDVKYIAPGAPSPELPTASEAHHPSAEPTAHSVTVNSPHSSAVPSTHSVPVASPHPSARPSDFSSQEKKHTSSRKASPEAEPSQEKKVSGTITPAQHEAPVSSAPAIVLKSAPAADNPNEIFPLVNERGITIGRAPRWQCHDGTKLLHPVVHLHVFNSVGELYLQKRPQWKDIQPGKWDTSVGGHVQFGETPEAALKREVREELGIEDFIPKFIKKYIFESQREKELVYVYRTVYDGEITPSAELDGGKFFTREEIKENKGKKFFTPNFEGEYPIL